MIFMHSKRQLDKGRMAVLQFYLRSNCLFLLDHSSVALPSPGGNGGGEDWQGTHAEKQDVESLLSGAKPQKWKVALQEHISVGV